MIFLVGTALLSVATDTPPNGKYPCFIFSFTLFSNCSTSESVTKIYFITPFYDLFYRYDSGIKYPAIIMSG